MNKRKIIVNAITSIALASSLAIGGTLALFATEASVDIAAKSATIEVAASVEEMYYKTLNEQEWTPAQDNQTNFDRIGGNAAYANGTLIMERLVSGDAIKFVVVAENKSDVVIKYRAVVKNVEEADTGLFSGLEITVDNSEFTTNRATRWTDLAVGEDPAKISVEITLPDTGTDADDLYFGQTCALQICIEAVQGNYNPETDFSLAPTPILTSNSYSLANHQEESLYHTQIRNKQGVWTFEMNADGSIGSNVKAFEDAADRGGYSGSYLQIDSETPEGVSSEFIIEKTYTFTADETTEEAAESDFENGTRYSHWGMDFVAYFDKPIKAYSAGVVGYLSMADWVGFITPIDLAAGEEVRIMEIALGVGAGLWGVKSIPYSLVTDPFIQEFTCAPIDVGYQNAGTTMTVELRLYELKYDFDKNNMNDYVYEETGNYHVLKTVKHTFCANPNA